MEVNATDIINALKNQRNGALDENAHLYALLEDAKRKIVELEQLFNKKATDGTDRDTVHAGNVIEQQGKQDSAN